MKTIFHCVKTEKVNLPVQNRPTMFILNSLQPFNIRTVTLCSITGQELCPTVVAEQIVTASAEMTVDGTLHQNNGPLSRSMNSLFILTRTAIHRQTNCMSVYRFQATPFMRDKTYLQKHCY